MKKIYLFLIVFITHQANAQTYQVLRDSAARTRATGHYTTALQLLLKGIAVAEHPYHNDLYDAAALAALTDSTDTAFDYLNRLLAEGEFDMVTCSAQNDVDFKKITQLPRWYQLMGKARNLKTQMELRKISAVAAVVERYHQLRAYTDSGLNVLLTKNYTGPALYNHLRAFKTFPLVSAGKLLSFAVKINDSTRSFYQIQFPFNYDARKSYPLLFVLHGAVSMNTSFPDPLSIMRFGYMDTSGMNQFFSQYGYRNNMIVVYPHGNREFNWMYPSAGFGMVRTIAGDLKHIFNIDDNKVFISGHSNGATGVVTYLLNDPSLFAAFYGFNANPRVRTGGTFLKNAVNRSYFNVSTDKDYYFPASGHDTLSVIARSLGIDWQNHSYRGYPHWFPQFRQSEPAFQLMFTDIARRERNPFHASIYWECDDVNNGACDWIRIDGLDTAAAPAGWHRTVNFTATNWVSNIDTTKVSDTVVTVFEFPRRSGAVKARYSHNRFEIETSRVNKIRLLLSPEMIDFTLPLRVYMNGRLVYSVMPKYDKSFMVSTFKREFDRKALWVNTLTFTL